MKYSTSWIESTKFMTSSSKTDRDDRSATCKRRRMLELESSEGKLFSVW